MTAPECLPTAGQTAQAAVDDDCGEDVARKSIATSDGDDESWHFILTQAGTAVREWCVAIARGEPECRSARRKMVPCSEIDVAQRTRLSNVWSTESQPRLVIISASAPVAAGWRCPTSIW